MPYTIYALDNEFAASTGSNVNSGPGTSTFDYPPTATNDLVIVSQEGDPSPEVFSVGDVYTLSWGGMGGGATEIEMTVLRSDPVSYNGQDGHAVVFGGTNEGGEPVQIVWSPGIDLEGWYFDNFNEGQSPGFYTTDQDPANEYSYVCFVAGTRLEIANGTCPVEALRPGDLVWTLDHGLQPVRWVGQRTVSGSYAMAPVTFAANAAENTGALQLSPQHRVLMTSWQAELMFGQPEILVPARALVGQPGVTQDPVDHVTYVHVLFDRHEIVLAENIASESLFLGEMSKNVLMPPADESTAEAGALLPDILWMSEFHNMIAARPVLRMREAVAFLNHVPPPSLRPPTHLF